MEATVSEVDEAKLEEFVGQAVTDMGAAMYGVLVMIGGELGLWRAMAGAGPLTSAEMAERTGVAERYVREWPRPGRQRLPRVRRRRRHVHLPPEQALAFADEDSPVYLPGGFT